MTEPLKTILQHPRIWQGQGIQARAPALATGHPALDQALPEGWPLGAVMELLVSTPGCGEISLLLPALIGLARQAGRIAWVSPPYLPYPPALFQKGLEQLLVIRSERPDDGLWASEQMLRSGACAAVLCWPGKALDDRRFRRLQLAAETGRSWGIVFRHRPTGNARSPAALRLAVTARHDQQHITVLKRRGAPPPAAIDLPRPTGIGP